MKKFEGRFVVATEEQQLLFLKAIRGQLSDGMWENSNPWEHYKSWCNCEVFVHSRIGRNFYADKDNYDLVRLLSIECVAEEMINMVKIFRCLPQLGFHLISEAAGSSCHQGKSRIEGIGVWAAEEAERGGKSTWYKDLYAELKPYEKEIERAIKIVNYTKKDLRKDLQEIKKAMKVRN